MIFLIQKRMPGRMEQRKKRNLIKILSRERDTSINSPSYYSHLIHLICTKMKENYKKWNLWLHCTRRSLLLSAFPLESIRKTTNSIRGWGLHKPAILRNLISSICIQLKLCSAVWSPVSFGWLSLLVMTTLTLAGRSIGWIDGKPSPI